jgi:hypothetical protein
MGTVRVQKNERYTVIANDCFADTRLSYKAIGLLCYLLSQPNDGKVSLDDLIATHADDKESVRAAIIELGKAGYMTRVREFGSFDYTVYERPRDGTQIDHPPAKVAPKTTALRVEDLNAIIKVYPRHRVGSDAEEISQAWNQAVVEHAPVLRLLLRDIERRTQSYDWMQEGGRYIPKLANYIKQKMWNHPVLEAPVREQNAGGRGVLVQ